MLDPQDSTPLPPSIARVSWNLVIVGTVLLLPHIISLISSAASRTQSRDQIIMASIVSVPMATPAVLLLVCARAVRRRCEWAISLAEIILAMLIFACLVTVVFCFSAFLPSHSWRAALLGLLAGLAMIWLIRVQWSLDHARGLIKQEQASVRPGIGFEPIIRAQPADQYTESGK
jgi:hypothetical protein